MIQTLYTDLFSLDVFLNFYENRACQDFKVKPSLDLEFYPTPQTQELLKTRSLVYKQNTFQSGFKLFSETFYGEENEIRLKNKSLATSLLNFYIKFNNPAFYNYADLLNDMQLRLYLSNRYHVNSSARNELSLTKENSGLSNEDWVQFKQGVLSYELPYEIIENKISLRHIQNGSKVNPSDYTLKEGKTKFTFHLENETEGLFELLLNDVAEEEFFYLSFLPPQLLGIVSIDLSAGLEANYRIIESGNLLSNQRPMYRIEIPSRATIWRYHFQLNKNNPFFETFHALNPEGKTAFLNNLQIKSNNPDLKFSLTDYSEETILFESIDPILLQEKYTYKSATQSSGLELKLEQTSGGGTKILKNYLPFPRLDQLNAVNPSKVYSEIFLTL